MPDTQVASTGAGITPWIGAAGGLISDITSLFGQSAANRQSQKYNTQMIQQQRKWALEDQAAQNLYNSPTAQMQRLKDAKLNPNMVYGTGVQGSTGQQSGQPRATAAPSYNPQSVTQGFSNLGEQIISALQQTANIENTKQQTKNLGQSLDNMKTDKINTEADIVLKNMQNKNYAEYGTPKVAAETDTAIAAAGSAQTKQWRDQLELAIAEATKQSTIQQAVQAGIQSVIKSSSDSKVNANLSQIGKNLALDEDLKKLDISSQTWEFNANSPVWQQVIQKLLSAILLRAHKD